jgi:putative (di)nucleoside polyphosphate hydrolase
MLLAEPEVRLLMRADGVDEHQLLETLSAIATRLRAEACKRRARGKASISWRPEQASDSGRYRPGVGIVLLNRPGKVFVGRRIDLTEDAWQLPQGGIDPGETPRSAALRELKEEIGTDNVEVIAESSDWLSYDLPGEIAGKAWGGRWQGQRQKWFVMLYLGRDEEIHLATEHPEFSAWREVPSLAVSFKRRLYRSLVREFDSVVDEPRRP